ncbi:SAV_6107 family HEPN domain-containing protein [Brachybacterium hainanense]|uniref:SAV_6107 family HEPN domain-containing protein n=1 Tax=Brachybacterium hainanense TaxID=1541174 RepID=A0ABV6RES8_9MICO
MASAHLTAAGRSRPSALLRRLEAELDALDRAEALLREGRTLSGTDPRLAYELMHRAALRAAGVVVARANRERRRKLPLNAWHALVRIGGEHRDWAEQMQELVAERDRLARREDLVPDALLLERHRELTTAHLAAVREEVLAASLPADLAEPPR